MDSTILSVYGDTEALRALGASIRDERLRRNWTQQHLADLVGISLPTYRKVEEGSPRVEIGHAARILGVFGYVDRLATLVPPSPPPLDLKALTAEPRQRARMKGVPS
jgi:transcriptional regulator with XRE-family HTH domain